MTRTTSAKDSFEHPPAPKLRMTATVVGVGLFPEEVVQDDTDRSALVLLTPAYTRKALPYVQYEWQGLVLRHGDRDVDAFKQRYVGALDPGSPQFFRVTSVTTFHTQQAVRPLSIALALFGAIAFLACVVLVGLALSRQLRSENEEREVLRAMGAAPAASSVAAAIGPLVAVLAGAALAVVLAIAASPSMPIGKVRAVEVARGFDADWTVLGFGALLLVALLGAVVGFTAWRASPHRGADRWTRRASLEARDRGPRRGSLARWRCRFAAGNGTRSGSHRGTGPVRDARSRHRRARARRGDHLREQPERARRSPSPVRLGVGRHARRQLRLRKRAS